MDELGVDCRAGFRRYAWSRRGINLTMVKLIGRGKRYNILLAMNY